MISAGKRAANASNAKKSTGPRTKEGKKRASMNSLTHGLTARIAILPDEDPGQFEHRMREWKEIFRPRNSFESYQTETAVYLSWQLARARRAQSARLCFLAETTAQDREKEQQREVAELTIQLFRSPAAARADGAQSPRHADQPGDSWPDSFDGANHPAVLVGRMESFLMGCETLRDHWTELAAILENGQVWAAAERFKAVRLLGAHPTDATVAPGLIDLLRACQVLDPAAGDLVNQLLPERLAATADRSNDTLPPMDESTARRVLLAIANVETERMADLAQAHLDRAEFEEALAPHQLAFDNTSDGEKMRRYEATCASHFRRLTSDLIKRKANAPGDRYSPNYTDYRTTRPDLHARVLAARTLNSMLDASDPIESSAARDTNGSPTPELQRPTTGRAPAATSQPSLRNEPTVAGRPDLRKEPKAAVEPKSQQPSGKPVVTPERKIEPVAAVGQVPRNEPTQPKSQPAAAVGPILRNEPTQRRIEPEAAVGPILRNEPTQPKIEPVAAVGQVQRNEPTGATFKGMHPGSGRPAVGGGSRRSRRARQAKDRANGIRNVENALNLTGPRPRNLLGIVPDCYLADEPDGCRSRETTVDDLDRICSRCQFCNIRLVRPPGPGKSQLDTMVWLDTPRNQR